MKKDDYRWHCLICEKEMQIASGDHPGSLNPATWPNIEGGTFSLDFGWPSKHDDLNFHDSKEWQGCICDECFPTQKHLMRHVRVKKLGSKWTILNEEDDNETSRNSL